MAKQADPLFGHVLDAMDQWTHMTADGQVHFPLAPEIRAACIARYGSWEATVAKMLEVTMPVEA